MWVSLYDMAQRASAVLLLGVYTTERCLADKGRYSYALAYMWNEDGNRFIQDMATTKVDGVRLTAKWNSRSRPSMPPLAHRMQATGGMDISYWHPMEGEITQTQLQGTVPQTQDGPTEPQNQPAKHGDPPMKIHSTLT